jgi:hypothetical protein
MEVLVERPQHSVTCRWTGGATYSRFGSGRADRLTELVAGKLPLKFHFPEAAIRH